MKFDRQPVITLRSTTRGPLNVKSVRLPVYVWNDKSGKASRFFLLVTQIMGANPQTKFSLCNAPETADQKTLALMQLQRYWVEERLKTPKVNVVWPTTRFGNGAPGIITWHW